MNFSVTQDTLGTHLEWTLEGVNAHMVDWFWSNMEKGFILWHPAQHEALEWAVPPKNGNPMGAIHIAPQTWNDGRRQNLYIRFEALEDVPEEIRDYIIYEHVIIVAGLGLGKESLVTPDPMGFRLHQWERRDYGIIGKSSAIGTRKKETPEEGRVWSEHCAEEIGNWEVFLPRLYTLYKVVKCPTRNPFADFSVEGKGRNARYAFIK
ncbi:MAG: hypothetical protein KKD44_20735 [Proteobacteria bacterium]|nr:hypothetical protein [Pseudomonadota bacterium]